MRWHTCRDEAVDQGSIRKHPLVLSTIPSYIYDTLTKLPTDPTSASFPPDNAYTKPRICLSSIRVLDIYGIFLAHITCGIFL